MGYSFGGTRHVKNAVSSGSPEKGRKLSVVVDEVNPEYVKALEKKLIKERRKRILAELKARS